MGVRHRPGRPLPYEARVYAGKDERGRSKVITRSYATAKQAEKGFDEITAQVKAGIAPDKPATVNDLLDRYLEDGELRRPDDMGRNVANWIRPFLGKLRIEQLTVEKIDRWTKMLMEKGWRGQPMSPRSAQIALSALSGACTLAVRYGYLPANPCLRARKRKTLAKDQAVKYVPAQEVVAHALAEAEEPLKLVLRVAVASGARRGELAALRRSCFDGRVLTIRESVEDRRGGPVLGATKNEKVRQVALDDRTCTLLREHLAMQEALAAIDGLQLADDPFIFSPVPECSKPFRADGLGQMMDRFVQATVEIDDEVTWLHPLLAEPKLTLHALRRAHATMLRAAGVPLGVIQQRLGHAHESDVTEDHYIGPLTDADLAATAVVGEFLDG